MFGGNVNNVAYLALFVVAVSLGDINNGTYYDSICASSVWGAQTMVLTNTSGLGEFQPLPFHLVSA